jgi:hypothetical protein
MLIAVMRGSRSRGWMSRALRAHRLALAGRAVNLVLQVGIAAH